MRLLTYAGIITLLITLNACAPRPGTPEAALKIKKEAIKVQEKKVDKTVSSIPQWCLNPPQSDLAFSACGFGNSSNMNMAKSRALLSAKRDLVDTFKSYVSTKMEDFIKTTGTSANEQVKQASEIVTKNISVETKLTGYRQKKTEVFSIDGKYQFYILLEYPVGQANQALLDQIKKDEILSTQKDADKAMAELEAEIEKRRKSKN